MPSERIRADKLHEFVEKAAKLRDKLNVQGMQAFATQFAQLAGEVPDDLAPLRVKLGLLARGLPQRLVEIVLKEDAKKPTPPLHEVINTVLSRAANKEQAVSYGGSSSSSGAASAASVAVDSISLASPCSAGLAKRRLSTSTTVKVGLRTTPAASEPHLLQPRSRHLRELTTINSSDSAML